MQQHSNRFKSGPLSVHSMSSFHNDQSTILQIVIFTQFILAVSLTIFTTMEVSVLGYGWERFLLSLLLLIVASSGILYEYTRVSYYLAAFISLMGLCCISAAFWLVIAVTSNVSTALPDSPASDVGKGTKIFLGAIFVYLLICLAACIFFANTRVNMQACSLRKRKKPIVASRVTAATSIDAADQYSSQSQATLSTMETHGNNAAACRSVHDTEEAHAEFSRIDESGTNKSIRGRGKSKSHKKSIAKNNKTSSMTHSEDSEMDKQKDSEKSSKASNESTLTNAVKSPTGKAPKSDSTTVSQPNKMRYLSEMSDDDDESAAPRPRVHHYKPSMV